MIKNPVFTRALIALALGSLFMSVPMTAAAMQSPHKRERETYFVQLAIMLGLAVGTDPTILVAEFQRRQAQVIEFFGGQAAQPQVAPRPPVQVLPLPPRVELQEELTPQRRVRARTEHNEEGGAVRIVEEDELTLRLEVTPWTAAIDDNTVYLIRREGIAMPRYNLGDRVLTPEEVIGLIVEIVERLLAMGVLHDDFYIGQAANPVVRSGGHFADVRSEDGMRKAARLRAMIEAGHMPAMQGFFRGAAGEQLDLLEGLLIMATRASSSEHGLCSRRPAKAIRAFYKQHLEQRIDALFAKHEAQRSHFQTLFCGFPKFDLNRFDEDDQDGDRNDGSSTEGHSTQGTTTSAC